MTAVAMSADTIDGGLPAWRLNLLRCAYLLLVVGLGIEVWPGIILNHAHWSLMGGVVQCMLGGLSLVAVLGLRQPLRMLPLMLFEIAWKVIWLSVVAAPQWIGGRMDASTSEVAFACGMAVILPPLIPWDHVARAFFAAPGARWR